jgi:hypothetical protein
MSDIIRKRTQGAQANRTGDVAEQVVASILSSYGVRYIRQQRIGEGIYEGRILQADFFLPDYEIIIESKWQSVGGTADEKLPYLCLNIKQRYPYPVVIVLGGIGWHPGSVKWIRDQVDGERLLHVLSFEEFMKWCGKQW